MSLDPSSEIQNFQNNYLKHSSNHPKKLKIAMKLFITIITKIGKIKLTQYKELFKTSEENTPEIVKLIFKAIMLVLKLPQSWQEILR